MLEVSCGPVPDDDRRIFVDELFGLRNGTVLGRYGPGRCLQRMLGRSLCIEHRAHSVHCVRCGSVRNCDGHCDVYGLCSGPVPGDDRRIGVDELHGMCNRPELGRDGPGSSVQRLLGWPVRIEHRAHSVHCVCGGSVRNFYGHCDVHGLCSRPVPGDYRCIGVNELYRMSGGAVLGRDGPGLRMHRLFHWSVRF